LNCRYAMGAGSGTVVIGGVGQGRPTWINLLKDELAEVFRTWMDAYRIDGQTLADQVNAWGGKKGSEATRQTISAYRNGRAMPRWFQRFMNESYPGWNDPKNRWTFVYGKKELPISNAKVDNEGVVKTREMLVIPDIDDPEYLAMLKMTTDEGDWTGPSAPGPDFLNKRLPFQRIRRPRHSPAFKVGDAILLLPNAEELTGRLFAVTDTGNGKSDYAALIEVEDEPRWQFYDGHSVPFEEMRADAAIVAHMPQYNPNDPEAIISARGLRVGIHVAWPKNY
jgi:hypothetical protein